MGRERRGMTNGNRRNQRRFRWGPITVTGALFAVVLGAFVYIAQSNVQVGEADRQQSDRSITDVAPDVESSSVASARTTPTAPARNNAFAQSSQSLTTDKATSQPSSDSTNPQQQSVVDRQPEPAISRADLVESQLAAGEFGPAEKTALSSADSVARSNLLALIADAQIASGEFDAARNVARRIADPQVREQTRRAGAAARPNSGGQADFTELIELILQNTSGPWEANAGEGGTLNPFETGVKVDPQGVLETLTDEDRQGRLAALGLQARVADLNEDMAAASDLRLVSLTRLEKAVSQRLAAGESALETMKHLAGLSQIRYVFVYPESSEVVIGGPAAGWSIDERGVPISLSSGRPTLQLDDLVTVLRTFAEGGSQQFRCLIVPRQEGMKQVKQFVAKSNARGAINLARVGNWTQTLQRLLGMQDVVVEGVPLDSRVARTIVEADYRMKLIGIGKLDGGTIPSFFDLLPPELQKNPPEANALRWWMTMKYDGVLHSPDHNVFEIRGSSVLCQSENEFITDNGERIHTGKAEPTNRLFAENFTKHFAQLAERDPAFADLQNIFDLSLVAALIHENRLDQRTDWDLGAFADGGAYQPDAYEPAEMVMSAVNHRVYNGRDIIVQVAGGVTGNIKSVLADSSVYKEGTRLEGTRLNGKPPQLPAGRWWWDAAK